MQINFPKKSEWWKTDYQGDINNHQKQCKKLIDKILSFGGKEVIVPDFEDDLDSIFHRGFYENGENADLNKGIPSQCHRNSCNLFENNDNTAIATGYALSTDGYWRQHSWCIDTLSGKIIETTEKRVAYFGFIMTFEEAEDFCWDNY